MSFQECLVLIAYLNFVIVPKTKHESRVSVKTDVLLKPHRVEKVGRPTNHSRAKLKDLFLDTTENNESNESNEWDTGPTVGNEIW